MSNDKKTSPVVAQKVEVDVKGNGTTLVQNANVINNYINNNGEVEVRSKSSGDKNPQTITVKPNQEQPQPKVDWRNVLPDAQPAEVNKILCNYTTKLNLHEAVGVPMVQIENNANIAKQKNNPENTFTLPDDMNKFIKSTKQNALPITDDKFGFEPNGPVFPANGFNPNKIKSKEHSK